MSKLINMNYKQKLIDLSVDLGIDYAWITPVLEDSNFSIWSGSGKPEHHHYGDGGLIKHTWEVVNLCMVVSGQYLNLVSSVKPILLHCITIMARFMTMIIV